MWLVLLVIYSAWICPFQFAFITYKKDAIFIIDNIVNGFFAIDIVLTFFVAYLDSHSYLLVDDPKKIAIRWQINLAWKTFFYKWIRFLKKNLEKCNVFRYLSTWFAFDVCSTAPFQPLSLLFNYNGSELGFRILSMLRLWRLRRVSSLFARFISMFKDHILLRVWSRRCLLNFSNSPTSLQAWERYTFQLLLDTMHKTHFRKSNIYIFFQRPRSFGFKSRTHKSY